MPPKTIDADRSDRADPYGTFRFRLIRNGVCVAGISAMSMLQRSAHIAQGRNEGDAITLERGITHDAAFTRWASGASAPGPASGRGEDTRDTIVIEMRDEAGQVAVAYRIIDCRVSEFRATAGLAADAGAMAIASIVLEHGGRERLDVTGGSSTAPGAARG